MNKIKIFLAAPISGFKEELEYKKNREMLLDFISKLQNKFQIYSEILNIGSLDSYDEPGQSAIKDFNEISCSDFFILYHPMNMQTSTLIELGYAVAKEKKIIIISNKEILPYLALGLSKYSANIKIISCTELNEEVSEQVKLTIFDYLGKSNIDT